MAVNVDKTLNQNYVIKAYNDLMKGVMPSEVKRKLMEGVYGPKQYSEDSAKHLMTAIVAKIKEDFETDKPILKEKLYSALNDLLTECRGSGDRKSAIKTLDSIIKLTGVAEEKQEINVNGNITIDFGFDDEGTD